MKKLLTAIVFAFLSLVGFSAFAKDVNFCLLATGPLDKGGKVVAKIKEADLKKGQTCDSWRAEEDAKFAQTAPKICQLRARGDQAFHGFEGIPPKDTLIIEGRAHDCDKFRYEEGQKRLKG